MLREVPVTCAGPGIGHHIVPNDAELPGPLAFPVLPWQHTRSGVCLERYSGGFVIHSKWEIKKKKKKME